MQSLSDALLHARKEDGTDIQSANEAENPLATRSFAANTRLYDPLDRSRKAIRVVRLQAAQSYSDPIVCNLEIVSLDSDIRYKALSYVCGQGTTTIEVSDHPLSVYPNLVAALKRVRRTDETLLVWADAICINQNDLGERTSQVQLMSDIFAGAEEVYACLSEGDDDSALPDDRTISLMKLFAQNPEQHFLRGFGDVTDITTRSFILITLGNLMLFLRKRWWRRIWTAQELVLARRITIYYFGKDTISYEDLKKFIYYTTLHAYTCCRRVKMMSLLNFTEDLVHMMKTILKLEEVRKIHREDPSGMSPLETISIFRERGATQAIDKIFGLVGISPLLAPSVDYSRTPQACFEDFALAEIKRTQTLDIFNHLATPMTLDDEGLARPQNLQPQSRLEGLPSWIPDWTHKYEAWEFTHLSRRASQTGMYSASKNTSASFDILEPGVIAVRGIMCGKIASVGALQHSDRKLAKYNFLEWIQLASKRRIHEGGSMEGGCYARFHNCLIGDMCFDEEAGIEGGEREDLNAQSDEDMRTDLVAPFFEDTKPHRRHKSTLRSALLRDKWVLRLTEYDKVLCSTSNAEECQRIWKSITEDDVNAYEEQVASIVSGRRFMITNRGEFGLVPGESRPGDMICVLYGGKTPYVLRPVNGGVEATESRERPAVRYQMLGDAYVEKFMDGRAVRYVETKMWRDRTFVLA